MVSPVRFWPSAPKTLPLEIRSAYPWSDLYKLIVHQRCWGRQAMRRWVATVAAVAAMVAFPIAAGGDSGGGEASHLGPVPTGGDPEGGTPCPGGPGKLGPGFAGD